jgi:electron transfer flavoprotein beta subunit
LGVNLNKDLLKKTLALGADELILLDDPAFADLDETGTSAALVLAVKNTGAFDIILAGRQAADWDAGQVGLLLAGILNIPAISRAKKVEFTGGKLRIERVTSLGYEIIEASLPAVVTVTGELGKLRLPNIKGILAAKKKEPVYRKAMDIGATSDLLKRRVKVARLYQQQREAKYEIIAGATPEEQGANLALKLRELKLI